MLTEILEEIDSTNRYLKEKCRSSEAFHGYSVLALRQTTGRGRLGRTFFSGNGGIYLSVALKNDSSMMLTAKAAVAVTRTIRKLCNIECGIKWVNDIFVNGRKVCGILAEGAGNLTVVGIGINYTTEAFPEELKDVAGSLFKSGEENIPEPIKLADGIVKELMKLSETEDLSWKKEYIDQSVLIGKNVNIIQAGQLTGSGLVTGFDDSCALCVRTEQGLRVLNTGEVSIRFAN